MDREYFKEYYNIERNHWWFRVRSRIIEQHLNKFFSEYGKLKILNIGIATGATTELLSKYGEVISIEYDRTCSIETHKRIRKPVVNGSVTCLPFYDYTFDIVCAFDVIEHVENEENAVSEMKRTCKKDGIVCVTVPSYMFLWSKHDEVNNHKKRYRLKELAALFSNCGEGVITYKSYFNTLLFPAIALFRICSKFIPDENYRKISGSDFSTFNESVFFNRLFYKIFSLEIKLLNFIKFPFGTSVLLSWKKM